MRSSEWQTSSPVLSSSPSGPHKRNKPSSVLLEDATEWSDTHIASSPPSPAVFIPALDVQSLHFLA